MFGGRGVAMGEGLMKKKPDLLMVLVILVGFGVLTSGYTMGDPDPEAVASQFVIR